MAVQGISCDSNEFYDTQDLFAFAPTLFFYVFQGLGSAKFDPKIDFRRSMGSFRVPLECYYFKVGFKSAFLEKEEDRGESFLRPGAHQGDLS